MTDHIGDTNKMIGNTPRTDAISLITEYLEIGGFFNPEIVNVQQHEAVRDTLMQAREELNAANDRIKRLEEESESRWNLAESAIASCDEMASRINRLEEAGDALAYNHNPFTFIDWTKAKEVKP